MPKSNSCSCVVVVCVLELLSATSCWAKVTKTERRDESLHARNSICHVCAARRCCSAVQPCLSMTSKTSTWPEVCVCVWNATGRQKKVIKHVKIKHAKIKHAEARGTKKHAGRTASLHANLPRKVPRRHRRPSRSKRATQCHLSHACHAKRRWM